MYRQTIEYERIDKLAIEIYLELDIKKKGIKKRQKFFEWELRKVKR